MNHSFGDLVSGLQGWSQVPGVVVSGDGEGQG